ncbi:YqaJ viral recombinase family protein [Dickeya chrysanthemi]|uniref:YqaJ viral recombinase family protein n=1 Tax=Dickeya chrysanthemi TaxID=556 RepID=UPI0030170010
MGKQWERSAMKIHNLVQGTDEWAAFRLTHHGASEAAAMLGLSKKVARSELLRIKHTGTPKEFTDWVRKNILDYGHEVEALARPLVEKIIGDDLYPVTCSDEDECGKLSASCDGLTLLEDTAFEHKQWNAELAASVSNNVLPDDHMPQCQQIMLVTGAQRVIFTVSDGTPDRLVWMEVLPDANWFERIRAGWAQFDRDLAEYELPAPAPTVVAEAVQDLPAVTVQVNGQIEVRENFKIFEVALRDFIENKLIREPQTDQDFADLDLQIKAMKKAEETLNAAESMMLAQIQSVDEAKRQKDMLAKLVRDNRLMAEKLLASEKERRRTEKVVAARKAFADHVTELQREISGVRLDIVVPDFAGAIKGLKTMSSIQDKIDTALANGKIAADQQAADLRTKLAWLDASAADYRALLADLQQLVAKPFDDFKLAVTARIDAHKKAEEARLEAERERIRQEEAARLEAEQRQQQEQQRPSETESSTIMAPSAPCRIAMSSSKQIEPNEPPALRLGQINDRLAPISLTADGLALLGIMHSATDKSAKLYHERDFSRICDALLQHIQSVRANAD